MPIEASRAAALPRHARFVRVTHWLTALAVCALLVSGIEIVLSHPRFYLGESGNVNTAPLFSLPVPSSRDTVPTGYDYVLPDQNGWSRSLHFQAAWLALFTGIVYVIVGWRRRHFATHFVPAPADRSVRALVDAVGGHLRLSREAFGAPGSYNVLQRLSYLIVVFVLFPLVVWTGLAMAPSFTSVVPWAVTGLGGRQSARTFHFVLMIALLLFTLVHIAMVVLTGFRERVGAMIAGDGGPKP